MTSSLKIIDQELAQFEWLESIATNSKSDFKSANIDVEEKTTTKNSLPYRHISMSFDQLCVFLLFTTSIYFY